MCLKNFYIFILGDWNDNVCNYLTQNLTNTNHYIIDDLLKVIINGKNVQFTDKVLQFNKISKTNKTSYSKYFILKNTETVKNLIAELVKLINGDDEKFALNASICIGKLGVDDCKEAIDELISIIERNSDWNKKSVALEAYVRHFDSTKNSTIEYILHQIANSPIWVSRSSGLKLLSFIG